MPNIDFIKYITEAPVVSSPADDEEPKKTKSKEKEDPFGFLNDLDNLGGINQLQPSTGQDDKSKKGDPKLRVSDKPVGSINPNDEMRDYLNRINLDQDDEISDQEAARRAGLDTPRLSTPRTDLVRREDVPAVLQNQLQVAGSVDPEWHTISRLPGYMQRAIRGMGRQMFSMFTRTPLEDIVTIAHVAGQGPNSAAELRAVGKWLLDNAEDMGEVDLDFGMAIPGYRPEVKEYRALGLRFQVVRDQFGQYIYAYPEADAVNRFTPRIEGQEFNDLPMLEAALTSKFIKDLYEATIDYYGLTESLLEDLIDEASTLSDLIKKEPSGRSIVRWMHAKYRLGAKAQWVPHPFEERLLWTEFKNNPDNFLILVGVNGIAAAKPDAEHIREKMERARDLGKVYNPARDNTLNYQVVAFRNDQQIDPRLLKDPSLAEPGQDPTVARMRGGMIGQRDVRNPINIFDTLPEFIGELKKIYIAKSAVEREKIAGRQELHAEEKPGDLATELQLLFNRVRPIMTKLVDQAVGIMNNRVKRLIDAGNYQDASKLAQTGITLKEIKKELDTSGDITLERSQFIRELMIRSLRALSKNYEHMPERAKELRTAAPIDLADFIDELRDNLLQA